MNLIFKTSLVLLILVSTLFPKSYKMEERWRWKHFTTEDGLPSSVIISVTETPGGTPWANTRDGLAWYNGYFWERMGQEQGLPQQQMLFVIPDFNESLLVVDKSKQLYYGGKHGFRPFQITMNDGQSYLRGAARYKNGKFLYLIDSSLIVGDTKNFEPYVLPERFSNLKIINLWNSGSGAIWLNTSKGLYRLAEDQWVLKMPGGKVVRSIPFLFENKSGYGLAYILGPPHDMGLWEWDDRSDPYKIVTEGIETVLSCDINDAGKKIILKDTDILKIGELNKGYEIVQLIPEVKNIISIKFRKNGDLWVGTLNGLYLFSATSKLWSQIKFPLNDNRNKINEIIAARDGAIWAGTSGGVISYQKDGTINSIKTIGNETIGQITGLVEDKEGNIWISSGYAFDGAYKWDGSRWTYYGVKDGLDAGCIHKIKMDRKGRLWFLGLYRKDFEVRGVEQEPGPYVYENGRFSAWGNEIGLPSGRYYALEEEDNGSIWFGTSEGLIHWIPDPKNSKKGIIKQYTIKDGSLLSNRIFTLTIDRNKTLWFGDRWSGLGYVKNDSIKYFTISDGLVSNDVWSITLDASGKLWIGTFGGLSIYDNGIFSSFKNEEGLENTKIWPILPLKDKVYIGTIGSGIQILNLREINQTYPKIVILPPMIERRNAYLRWKVFSEWGTQYANNIEVRYRIDNAQWSRWSNERGLLLNDLPSGEHKIYLQGKNIFGAADTTQNLFTFTIPSPFYVQPEFLVPVGLLTVGLIILGFAYLIKKRKDDLALKNSEHRYRNLFETANDAIIVIDPESKLILEVNSKACEIYGYTRTEFKSLPYHALLKNKNANRDEFLWSLKEGDSKIYEASYLTKDGRSIYVHISASIVDYGDKPVILSNHRDISELREAEAQIRLLAQTITSAQDFISITALDNTILFVNDAFTRGHGYSDDELIGKNISVIRSPITPKEILEQLNSTESKENWNGEVFHRRKDGTDFPVELWSALVQDEENQPVAIVNVSRDITDRKKYESERENLILELQNALTEVKTLSGLLPICSSCKKIRDDKGYWIQVETYISKHSDATFTHGLCPECLKQYYPEVYERLKLKGEQH